MDERGIVVGSLKSDYEKGLLNSLGLVFVGVKITGCFFHWCQSLFRYVIGQVTQ